MIGTIEHAKPKRDVMIYEGNKAYVFVSYSHKDSSVVVEIIEGLMAQGFRVWYDPGIEPGAEWPEYIAEHIDSCSVFLTFMSENASVSPNCRQEVHRAIQKGKDVLVAYIEPTQLTPGMEMRLAPLQAVFRWRFDSGDEFISALGRAKILQECRESGIPNDAVVEVGDVRLGKRDERTVPVIGCEDERRDDKCSGNGTHRFGGGAAYEGVPRGGKRNGAGETAWLDDGVLEPKKAHSMANQHEDALGEMSRDDLCLMGDCFFHGIDAEQDDEMAVVCYKASAKKGSVQGKYNLGYCYLNGIGVEQDYEYAAKYFQESAKAGNPDAEYATAYCCSNAYGIERDQIRLEALLAASARQGNKQATIALRDTEHLEAPKKPTSGFLKLPRSDRKRIKNCIHMLLSNAQ